MPDVFINPTVSYAKLAKVNGLSNGRFKQGKGGVTNLPLLALYFFQ